MVYWLLSFVLWPKTEQMQHEERRVYFVLLLEGTGCPDRRAARQQALNMDGHTLPCIRKQKEMGIEAQLAFSFSFRPEP